MNEYKGPTVHQVVSTHPAVQIEFSGDELDVLLHGKSA